MGDRAQNAHKTIRRFPDIEVGVHFLQHPISVPLLVVSGHAFGGVPAIFCPSFPARLHKWRERAHPSWNPAFLPR